MVKIALFSLWKDKEKKLGRRITAGEVSSAIGISRNTVTAYLDGSVKRPDLEVIGKFCKFFGVTSGSVPFIVYKPVIMF